MALKNTTTGYGSLTKSLHWLIFLFIVSLIPIGFFMGDIPVRSIKFQVYNLHKLFGLLVLLLMIVRLAWRWQNVSPQSPLGVPRWQQKLATCVHYLLYALLIAMPVSGWVMATAAGHYPHLWSLQLPLLGLSKNKLIATIAANIHQILAWTIIVTVSLHILAAIKHHFIDKNEVLTRILFRSGSKSHRIIGDP